jgi:hypothetical protein
MKINYYGAVGRPTGYGHAASDYCMALLRQGIDLRIVAVPELDTAKLPSRYAKLVPCLLDEPFSDPTHTILHAAPAGLAELVQRDDVERRGKSVAITTWETDCLPGPHANLLANVFDRVIVPSSACNDALMRGYDAVDRDGEHVRIVPHALDADFWVRDDVDGRAHGPQFVFYSMSHQPEVRKNVDGLVLAYFLAFAGMQERDDVVLRILAPGWTAQQLPILRAATGVAEGLLPRVEVLVPKHGPLSDDEVYALHSEGHCYVTATRGEGWCLPLFEAIAVGNTTISPQWGGHLDYLSGLGGGHLVVSGRMTPAIAVPELYVNDGKVVARRWAPEGLTFHEQWFDCDLTDLANSMHAMFMSDVGKRRGDGLSHGVDVDRRALAKRYSHEAVGKQLLEALA